ncbi:hypothetical protein [Collinsella stercoris]|uniref:hypothetical protein n=1 Tax=Collinsella stercoris TaxID=147206 RepID=UPI003AF0F84D
MSSKKAPKNKYVTKSHLSERKFRELPRLFCADVTALSAASLTGLNRNTANRYHGMPRARIAEICEADSPFDGEVEADESYFGARRARGVRGRGARGETIAFGLPERGRQGLHEDRAGRHPQDVDAGHRGKGVQGLHKMMRSRSLAVSGLGPSGVSAEWELAAGFVTRSRFLGSYRLAPL